LVKDVFFDQLRRTPTVKEISDLVRLSPPLTLADSPVYAIEPPKGFEALTTAIAEGCDSNRKPRHDILALRHF